MPVSRGDPDPIGGEPVRSPRPPLSAAQAQQLIELEARLKAGRAPAKPRTTTLSSEEARRRSRAYWDKLTPEERRIRMLSARIGAGRAAERELEALLAQLEQQHGDEGTGGES